MGFLLRVAMLTNSNQTIHHFSHFLVVYFRNRAVLQVHIDVGIRLGVIFPERIPCPRQQPVDIDVGKSAQVARVVADGNDLSFSRSDSEP